MTETGWNLTERRLGLAGPAITLIQIRSGVSPYTAGQPGLEMMFRFDYRMFSRSEAREPRSGKSLFAVRVCHAGDRLFGLFRSQPSRVAVSSAIDLVSSRFIHDSSSEFDGGSPSPLVVFVLLGHPGLGVRSHVRVPGLNR